MAVFLCALLFFSAIYICAFWELQVCLHAQPISIYEKALWISYKMLLESLFQENRPPLKILQVFFCFPEFNVEFHQTMSLDATLHCISSPLIGNHYQLVPSHAWTVVAELAEAESCHMVLHFRRFVISLTPMGIWMK